MAQQRNRGTRLRSKRRRRKENWLGRGKGVCQNGFWRRHRCRRSFLTGIADWTTSSQGVTGRSWNSDCNSLRLFLSLPILVFFLSSRPPRPLVEDVSIFPTFLFPSFHPLLHGREVCSKTVSASGCNLPQSRHESRHNDNRRRTQWKQNKQKAPNETNVTTGQKKNQKKSTKLGTATTKNTLQWGSSS